MPETWNRETNPHLQLHTIDTNSAFVYVTPEDGQVMPETWTPETNPHLQLHTIVTNSAFVYVPPEDGQVMPETCRDIEHQ
jgi:hypothetical protein